METVELTWQEVMTAAQAAIMRRTHHIFKGATCHIDLTHLDATKHPPRWQMDINGCLGELAVSKYLGSYWTGLTKTAATDAGLVDVRATEHERGALWLKADDHNERPYVLAIIKLPLVELAGWIYGLEGKLNERWCEKVPGRPAFWTEQKDLHPMDEL